MELRAESTVSLRIYQAYCIDTVSRGLVLFPGDGAAFRGLSATEIL